MENPQIPIFGFQGSFKFPILKLFIGRAVCNVRRVDWRGLGGERRVEDKARYLGHV